METVAEKIEILKAKNDLRKELSKAEETYLFTDNGWLIIETLHFKILGCVLSTKSIVNTFYVNRIKLAKSFKEPEIFSRLLGTVIQNVLAYSDDIEKLQRQHVNKFGTPHAKERRRMKRIVNKYSRMIDCYERDIDIPLTALMQLIKENYKEELYEV